MHTKHNNLSYGDNHSKPLDNVEYIHSPFCKENPYTGTYKLNGKTRKEQAMKNHVEKISHDGKMKLGGQQVRCYVTQAGVPLMSTTGAEKLLKVAETGSEQGFVQAPKNKAGKMGQFFASKGLRPAVEAVFGKSETLKMLENKKGLPSITGHILRKDGSSTITGYTAQTFSRLCDVMAIAFNLGLAKTKRQKIVAEQALRLKAGFQEAGVAASIYEATGFEASEAKKLNYHVSTINAFLGAPKKRTFYGSRFFDLASKVSGYFFDSSTWKMNPAISRFIDQVMYKDSPNPAVANELKRRNPPTEYDYRQIPRRAHTHHAFFSTPTGEDYLRRRRDTVEGVMALCVEAGMDFNKHWPSVKERLAI